MKLIHFLCLFLIPFVQTHDICEPGLKLDEYPSNLITSNTKIFSGIAGTKNVLNTSSVQECVKFCCQDPLCNFAFLQNSAICILISCLPEKDSCQIALNDKKYSTDPIDYLVKVKEVASKQTTDFIESLISQEKEDLESYLSNKEFDNECSPDDNSCQPYEICRLGNMNVYQCVCPIEYGFQKIDGKCREYLSKTKGCEMYIDRCPLNEECVIRNKYRKKGSCQCLFGFRRNIDTFECEPDSEMAKNRRRRPPVVQEESKEDEESFWEKIFQTIGLRSKKISKDETTLTSTKATDPPKIFTSNLQANAGPNINVYYPSRLCILNGSLNNFLGAKKINKWEWTKDSSSPAFGRFVGTNEAQIVVYENMIEGEYKFLLKVWSEEGEFSQDFVHVFVHGSTYPNIPAQYQNVTQINQNIIEIELEIEPSLFSESLKFEFLNKLQNFLLKNQDFKLTDPKLVLISSRLSLLKQKSSVVLEILVTDLINSSKPSGIGDDLIMGDKNRYICPSAPIVLNLRKKQKSFKSLLDSIQTIIERIQTNGIKNQTLMDTIKQTDNKKNQVLDFLNVKILSIRQTTCFDDRLFDQQLNNTYSCSGHGTCDMHSRKCICKKYWMPNYARYFFNYESDLTDGNNCEYNIPLTVLVLILIGLLAYVTLKVVFKYFFYYLCCCCLCCRRIKIENQKTKRLLGDSKLDDSYLNDSIDADDFDKKYKKRPKGFLDRLRIVPSSNSKRLNHKYALLQSDENDSINESPNNDGLFKKNEQLGAQLDLNDDEEVVYEEAMIKDSKRRKNNKDNSIKKYNLI